MAKRVELTATTGRCERLGEGGSLRHGAGKLLHVATLWENTQAQTRQVHGGHRGTEWPQLGGSGCPPEQHEQPQRLQRGLELWDLNPEHQ